MPPGFVDAPPPPHPRGLLWARRPDADGAPRQHADRGVRWSASAALVVTPAAVTTCRKCGQKKPEVCTPFLALPTRPSAVIDPRSASLASRRGHTIVAYATAASSSTITTARSVPSHVPRTPDPLTLRTISSLSSRFVVVDSVSPLYVHPRAAHRRSDRRDATALQGSINASASTTSATSCSSCASHRPPSSPLLSPPT